MSIKKILLLLSGLIVLTSNAEEFQGRHVCSHQKTIAEPVPVQQSYIRAVHRKDLQRVVYQTAYKTVFKMQIRSANVSGCCPGWEKQSPRDTSCMKPLCDEGCENEGQCVGPEMCVCSEGYTGYKCHIDIDECSGRNTCQQKCTNLPGSYECSCQEGFQLADDEYTCDLCLSCTDEFKSLYAQIESIQTNNRQGEVFYEIKEQVDNLTQIVMQTETIQIIQTKLENLSQATVPSDRFESLQKEVDSLKDKIKEGDIIKELNKRIDSLQQTSVHTEAFREIQSRIDDLDEVKSLVYTVQTLNDTIHNLQEDDTQAKKLQDMQKQIEDLAIVKAQQDEAEADRFEEMHKGLEQLQLIGVVSESVSNIKDLLDQLSDSVEDLEDDKQENLKEITAQAERILKLQKHVDTLKDMIQQGDYVKELTARIDQIQESSRHEETFLKIQNQIDDLAEVKTLVDTVQTLNNTLQRLQEDDTAAREQQEMRKQIDDITVSKAQQEKAQSDRFEEIAKELEHVRELSTLTELVNGMKNQLDQMSNRIQELEADKGVLQRNLTEAVSQYEAAVSAFHAKEVNREHVTTDPYEMDQKIPLDRLVSLSEQISILEERMADCACNQDYHNG